VQQAVASQRGGQKHSRLVAKVLVKTVSLHHQPAEEPGSQGIMLKWQPQKPGTTPASFETLLHDQTTHLSEGTARST
jgi:hypothetical protein